LLAIHGFHSVIHVLAWHFNKAESAALDDDCGRSLERGERGKETFFRR
jgi:hypothetical protein